MFVYLEILRSSQQIFSHVRTEPSLPQYKPVLWGVSVLLKDTIRYLQRGLNPEPLDSEFYVLPLRPHPSNGKMCGVLFQNDETFSFIHNTLYVILTAHFDATLHSACQNGVLALEAWTNRQRPTAKLFSRCKLLPNRLSF